MITKDSITSKKVNNIIFNYNLLKENNDLININNILYLIEYYDCGELYYICIYIKGKLHKIKSPYEAIKYGIGLVPEERKSQGFISVFNNGENITLTDLQRYVKHMFVQDKKKLIGAEEYIKKTNVQPRNPKKFTSELSGGNQQKVVIAKWLHRDSEILILDEPTKGIDVGAKEEIYNLLEELASIGKTIIIVSSELPEVVGICDTVLVMSEGKQIKVLRDEFINEQEILKYALGGDSHE
jgi:ABC-type sugar transport system ATPase subunit